MITWWFSSKFTISIFVVLSFIGCLDSLPVEEKIVVDVKVEDNVLPNPASISKEQPVKQFRQDEDTEEEAFSLSPTQVDHIGNNVVKVVTSSLTGNLPGIFGGGLNLLNTNNRVNSILGILGVTTLKPVNGTAVSTAAPVGGEQEEEDDEDDDSRRRKLSLPLLDN